MRPDASKKLAAAAPKQGPNVVVIGAVIAAVIVVVVVVAIMLGSSSENSTPAGGSGSSAVPANVIGGVGGGIVANAPAVKSGAPTLDIYEDFQCPACGALEQSMGPVITSMAKAGEIKLVVHTLSFLDGNLKNDSSTRAAIAAACASDAGKFLEYHNAVYAGMPTQEGVGYPDAQLAEFAKTAGITGPALTTWQQCTSSAQYAKYVTDVQAASQKAGVTGTPTVKLNGKDITKTLADPDGLVAQVKAATK